MSYIIACNTGSDTLSRIDIKSMEIVNLNLRKGIKPFGPHGISVYNNHILCANSYNNSISIIDAKSFEEKCCIYAGSHPNDVICHNGKMYVLCGEANSVNVYDIENYEIEYDIPVGIFPHNISIDYKTNIGFICNWGEDSISVLDFGKNEIINTLKIGEIPIKSIVANNKKYLFVLISNIGFESNGKVIMIDLENYEFVNEIETGHGSADMYEYEGKLYVSNLCDSSISMINLQNFKEESKISLKASMPRGLVVHKNSIYCNDYMNGILNIIDLENNKIKALSIGKEPNALMLFEN